MLEQAQTLNMSEEVSAKPPSTDSGSHERSDVIVQAIELERQEHRSLPPVYQNATVITVQPHSEENPHRRPLPINTLDWVSTPRSQLSVLSGTHLLAGVEQLEIQRIVDLSTLLGRADKGNQYRVKVPKAETIFLAMEKPADQGKALGLFAGYVLNVLDQSGETAFTINKNPSWRYLPGPLHKITVESTKLIGSVEQNFTLIGHTFTVYDELRNPLCYIYGPNVCGCCMYKEAQFQVISVDGSHQIATFMHQWDSTLVDYSFLITFPVDTDIKLKNLLLAASFLLEHLFFQRVQKASKF